ncbi:MAG: hypothetical protein R8G66_25315 [Cytophagales bacterium]|nr:hypothetical protein [Cytophagales bacterium]
MRNRHGIFLLTLLLAGSFSVRAQRMEIDRLERDFRDSFRSRAAYELSQKFIQIDSTYYTGYYYEGIYRYLRASDQLGYKLALKPLKKGLTLMEKDYRRELRRIKDLQTYAGIYEIQRKYAILCDLLIQCYNNTDQLDKSIVVIRKLLDRQFIYNWEVNPYAHLSWMYHKNRVYTSEKYPFLSSSIEGNVKLASKYADSILINNRKNYQFISQYITSGFDPIEGSYWHYKDIVYSYLLNVDSAEFSAKNLKRLGRLSNNNYGNLQFIQARFEEAEKYYDLERDSDGYFQKETKEFDYMQSVINIFKNDLGKAKGIVQNSMDIMGPSPGYGWNNIAMARVNYYSGDLAEAKTFRDKAANFKELHINSTWGKVQYDRNTKLFEYLYHQGKMNEIKFLNRNYWRDGSDLWDMAGHYFQKENAHLLLTSELSVNPERFLVLYNIFASENTIFFDEIWELIKDFNPNYFIRLFEKKLANEPREGIKKYLNYYIARFYLLDNEVDRGIGRLNAILEAPDLDTDHEKLLIARVHEALSLAYDEKGQTDQSAQHLMDFYKSFPQLVPFSESTMKFKLQLEPTPDNESAQLIVEELESVNVDWTEEGSWPVVKIGFEESEEGLTATYEVVDEAGGAAYFSGAFKINKYEDPAAELIYRLFGVNRVLK